MLVFDRESFPHLDLRVDEHHDPVGELRQMVKTAKRKCVPLMAGMPTRANPLGALGEDVAERPIRSPADRPGGTLSSS